MIIEDSFTLDAPIERVWGLMQDIPRVSRCMPGVEGVEQIEPDLYKGVLNVKIGPIRAAFGGKVAITERIPMSRMQARLEGDDRSSATRVKATFTATFVPEEAGTRINYELDAALLGRLAQFGLAVFRSTAKKMTNQFAACVREQLVVPAE